MPQVCPCRAEPCRAWGDAPSPAMARGSHPASSTSCPPSLTTTATFGVSQGPAMPQVSLSQSRFPGGYLFNLLHSWQIDLSGFKKSPFFLNRILIVQGAARLRSGLHSPSPVPGLVPLLIVCTPRDGSDGCHLASRTFLTWKMGKKSSDDKRIYLCSRCCQRLGFKGVFLPFTEVSWNRETESNAVTPPTAWKGSFSCSKAQQV